MAARKIISNLLILSSVLLLLFIYLPFLRAYISSPKPSLPEGAATISIPKISAYAPLIDNVDPWNEKEYQAALKNGVAIAKGFSKPGEPGTTYVFAHSSDSPWNITSYNTVFLRLGELESGDLVEITYNGRNHKYEVTHTIEVWPNQVETLTKTSGNQLILQTCTPIGTSLKRLLVFATLRE